MKENNGGRTLSRYPGYATCLPRQAAVKTPEDRVQYAHPCAIQPHAQIMFDLPINPNERRKKDYDIINVLYKKIPGDQFFTLIFWGRYQLRNPPCAVHKVNLFLKD